MFLLEILHHPLNRYSVVTDEANPRTLGMDLLMVFLRALKSGKRKYLNVIIIRPMLEIEKTALVFE